jgi:hypothetical protein
LEVAQIHVQLAGQEAAGNIGEEADRSAGVEKGASEKRSSQEKVHQHAQPQPGQTRSAETAFQAFSVASVFGNALMISHFDSIKIPVALLKSK